ncbi:MAG: hypothetical protein LCH83_01215 [Proteobacteria bacterium]|nr:hypothetical protein [Pseudomonadota bacterium]
MAHPDLESANELFKVLGNWNYLLNNTSLAKNLPAKKAKRYKPDDDSPLNQSTLRPYKKSRITNGSAKEVSHD